MRKFWDFTDVILKTLKKRYIKEFRSLQSLVKADEVHRLHSVQALYEDVDVITRDAMKFIADEYYRRQNPKGRLPDDWLEYYIEYFDPVTKYQYDKEVERKAARCFESLMASKNLRPEIKTALKLWTLQATHYCEEVTKQATIRGMKDRGVTQVVWRTARDEKVCEECDPLDGKVFDIDNIPPTPHYNCRCTVEAYGRDLERDN